MTPRTRTRLAMRLPRAGTLVALPALLLAGCSTVETAGPRATTDCPMSLDRVTADGLTVSIPNPDWRACMARNAEAARPVGFAERLADTITPLAVAGLLGLLIGLVLLTSGPTDVPKHRDQRGPAWGAARAAAGQRKCAGWALGAVGATVALWGFAPDQRAPMVIAAVIIGGLSGWRASVLESAKAGFEEADRDWQAEAQLAELAGERPPSEPELGTAAAVDLGRRGGWHPEPGSALEALTDRSGGIGPARAGWHEVAQAMGAGTTDERGRFTPWATLVSVTDAGNGADARVTWHTEDVTKVASSLGQLMPPLARHWRVESISTVATDHATGDLYTIVSNGSAQPDHPAEPERPADSDGNGWDF